MPNVKVNILFSHKIGIIKVIWIVDLLIYLNLDSLKIKNIATEMISYNDKESEPILNIIMLFIFYAEKTFD
ncbi:MAG: hypothetical protein PHX03_05525 [Bacilli bacterium]|nr:hypothetical protein [Bacilli bacterium]MDD4406502.1 hypothetical protein [Bacilli bacterium]